MHTVSFTAKLDSELDVELSIITCEICKFTVCITAEQTAELAEALMRAAKYAISKKSEYMEEYGDEKLLFN